MADDGIREGDHLEIHAANKGVAVGTLRHLDGTSEPFVAQESNGSNDGVHLEPCPGAGGAPVYHVEQRGRGPARCRSENYCANYDKILWNSKKRGRKDIN